MTEEKLNLNYTLWVDMLKKYDCYSDEMISDIGDKLKVASFSLTTTTGSAYEGSMIDTVLNHLCVIAYHINEDAFGFNNKHLYKHPRLKVNIRMLMRVLLLQHISKAEIFKPSDSQWKIKNGALYEFNDELQSILKTGERSIFLCQKYGIKLAEEEFEAMRIIDKEEDLKNNSFINPLCLIVKIANQLTAIEVYRNNIKTKEILEK